ncbi:acyl-CoA carboxylase subunit epsilon [Kibdelosporangium aridum]|uniref:acyl-CoA carboxylase subunit epsilon n=1 Tax=Kibdelosporangium aridum TaxID=2030 RepID=UPI0035E69DCE
MTPAGIVVLKGQPDDEELAALIAVVSAIKAKAAQQASCADRESLWATGPGRPHVPPARRVDAAARETCRQCCVTPLPWPCWGSNRPWRHRPERPKTTSIRGVPASPPGTI